MNRLTLAPVAALPTPREGFIDCGTLGCEANALRLSTDCRAALYLPCYGCRNLLIHAPLRGWSIKKNSREEVACRREDARAERAANRRRVA
jgi:hypothetical protein